MWVGLNERHHESALRHLADSQALSAARAEVAGEFGAAVLAGARFRRHRRHGFSVVLEIDEAAIARGEGFAELFDYFHECKKCLVVLEA